MTMPVASTWRSGAPGLAKAATNSSNMDISDGGQPKTTEQMQTQATFNDAGWDFVEIWNIGENQTYPYLRVYPAGDLNHDKKVNLLDFAVLGGNWLEGRIN